MTLKGERVVLETDITLTCDSEAEAGVVLCYETDGSGVALGDRAGEVDLIAAPSGYKVAGLLMNDVEDVDETQHHRNFHKDVTKPGERCTLLRKGRVTTNKITGTPAVGGTAYLTANGVLTPTMSATGGIVATPKVGQFVSLKDENGYVTVDVMLPTL